MQGPSPQPSRSSRDDRHIPSRPAFQRLEHQHMPSHHARGPGSRQGRGIHHGGHAPSSPVRGGSLPRRRVQGQSAHPRHRNSGRPLQEVRIQGFRHDRNRSCATHRRGEGQGFPGCPVRHPRRGDHDADDHGDGPQRGDPVVRSGQDGLVQSGQAVRDPEGSHSRRVRRRHRGVRYEGDLEDRCPPSPQQMRAFPVRGIRCRVPPGRHDQGKPSSTRGRVLR